MVPKFVADSPNKPTYAIQFDDSLDAVILLTISLQLQGTTSYFDMHSQSITEYENEKVPKIYLAAEKPAWNPSTEEYSERHVRQIIKDRSSFPPLFHHVSQAHA